MFHFRQEKTRLDLKPDWFLPALVSDVKKMLLLTTLDNSLQVILETGKTVSFSRRNVSSAFISALQTDVINSAQTQICITLTSE